jgi:pseudaminic acid synthase
MEPFLDIEGHRVGVGQPTFIIAEMSGNHGQSLDQAIEIVRAAKASGADAIKLQTYTADTLTIDCDAPPFQIRGGPWNGRRLYELYQEAYTPWQWQPKLKRVADDLGLTLFSTPFDDTAVEFLEGMSVPAYKIASFELVDTALLQRVAQTKKPIIMSTGMATLSEIDQAMTTLRDAGAEQIALLKCTSAYPAMPEEMNLRTIPHLAEGFGVPVGLSDHTLDLAVPVAAVTLGACIIEKHFTLCRSLPGPDSAFSLEPDEFGAMVRQVRIAEKALGQVSYGVGEREASSRVFRRSLFVVRDLKRGEPLTPQNIRSIRPGTGLSPRHLPDVIGRRAAKDIQRGTPLHWQLLA